MTSLAGVDSITNPENGRSGTTPAFFRKGRITMTGSCVEQFRDMIPYPCCPQYKAGVEMSAHGRASHPCPNCGKFVEFDYDNLTAKIVKPFRGAAHRFHK